MSLFLPLAITYSAMQTICTTLRKYSCAALNKGYVMACHTILSPSFVNISLTFLWLHFHRKLYCGKHVS